MSEDRKLCVKCGKEAKLLPAGAYQRDESTWVVFDNEERRGYKCSDSRCAWIFGAPVGTYSGDPEFELKSIDGEKEFPRGFRFLLKGHLRTQIF
jgi:hypothetical protein